MGPPFTAGVCSEHASTLRWDERFKNSRFEAHSLENYTMDSDGDDPLRLPSEADEDFAEFFKAHGDWIKDGRYSKFGEFPKHLNKDESSNGASHALQVTNSVQAPVSISYEQDPKHSEKKAALKFRDFGDFVNADSWDEDSMDPSYAKFLKNLSRDGSSYVVQLTKSIMYDSCIKQEERSTREGIRVPNLVLVEAETSKTLSTKTPEPCIDPEELLTTGELIVLDLVLGGAETLKTLRHAETAELCIGPEELLTRGELSVPDIVPGGAETSKSLRHAETSESCIVPEELLTRRELSVPDLDPKGAETSNTLRRPEAFESCIEKDDLLTRGELSVPVLVSDGAESSHSLRHAKTSEMCIEHEELTTSEKLRTGPNLVKGGAEAPKILSHSETSQTCIKKDEPSTRKRLNADMSSDLDENVTLDTTSEACGRLYGLGSPKRLRTDPNPLEDPTRNLVNLRHLEAAEKSSASEEARLLKNLNGDLLPVKDDTVGSLKHFCHLPTANGENTRDLSLPKGFRWEQPLFKNGIGTLDILGDLSTEGRKEKEPIDQNQLPPTAIAENPETLKDFSVQENVEREDPSVPKIVRNIRNIVINVTDTTGSWRELPTKERKDSLLALNLKLGETSALRIEPAFHKSNQRIESEGCPGTVPENSGFQRIVAVKTEYALCTEKQQSDGKGCREAVPEKPSPQTENIFMYRQLSSWKKMTVVKIKPDFCKPNQQSDKSGCLGVAPENENFRNSNRNVNREPSTRKNAVVKIEPTVCWPNQKSDERGCPEAIHERLRSHSKNRNMDREPISRKRTVVEIEPARFRPNQNSDKKCCPEAVPKKSSFKTTNGNMERERSSRRRNVVKNEPVSCGPNQKSDERGYPEAIHERLRSHSKNRNMDTEPISRKRTVVEIEPARFRPNQHSDKKGCPEAVPKKSSFKTTNGNMERERSSRRSNVVKNEPVSCWPNQKSDERGYPEAIHERLRSHSKNRNMDTEPISRKRTVVEIEPARFRPNQHSDKKGCPEAVPKKASFKTTNGNMERARCSRRRNVVKNEPVSCGPNIGSNRKIRPNAVVGNFNCFSKKIHTRNTSWTPNEQSGKDCSKVTVEDLTGKPQNRSIRVHSGCASAKRNKQSYKENSQEHLKSKKRTALACNEPVLCKPNERIKDNDLLGPVRKKLKDMPDKSTAAIHTGSALCKPNERSNEKGFSKAASKKFKSKKMSGVISIDCQMASKREKRVTWEDAGYQVFLNNVSWIDNSLVLKYGDIDAKYEDYGLVEDSSDSEVLGTDSPPLRSKGVFATSTPNVVVDVDENCCITSSSTNESSNFRKNLMDILRKPYDYSEYQDLMKKATYERQLEKDRDLRSTTKTYRSGLHAKSYLSRHRAVLEKIKSLWPDPRKILNVLRGFFFWLENLPVDGAFPPWLDDSCLAVMPR